MTARNDVHDGLKQVRDDVSALREDLGDVTQALLQLGRNKMNSARETIADKGEAGRDALKDLVRRLDERREALGEKIEDGVRTHPMVTILSAFGAGFLVSKILDRS